MSDNGIKVDGGEFWVVEIREGADIEAWVYGSEDAAIDELMDHVPWDDIDLDDLDMEEFFANYSVQRVEIGESEYSVQGVSPHQILIAQIQNQR